ncbi:MAG: hypothetical protein HY593_00400 [Candidatus Omnitrophica bacterium]|nr:hypothetical protein [Candidatus Omnitrophota bacterium]
MKKTGSFSISAGYVLIEALASLAIGVVLLASVLSAWYFSTKVWKEENIRGHLRYKIEKSMERIKEDIRLSDGSNILFYPQNAAVYEAVSLPRAVPGQNDFLSFANGTITWNQTVVYHLYTLNGKKELRRTVFDAFNPDTAVRQTQLDFVVVNGEGADGVTTVLFAGDDTGMEIVPQALTFDAYAAATERSILTNFGSIQLTPGAHTVRFEITGKNASSSGYRLGLDSLSLTPSGGIREMEVLPIAGSSGQTSLMETMAPSGVWGGNHQIEYGSSSAGHFIDFETYYDQWIESNFSNMTHSNTTVAGSDPRIAISSREDQGASPSWQASAQTLSGTTTNETLIGEKSVRSVIAGASITKSANMIRIKFMSGTNAGLTVYSAFFGRRQGGTSDFDEAPIQLFFDNPPVLEGAPDPPGAMNPGTTPNAAIPAGYHAWSNWFEYVIDTANPVPDYLVSMHTADGSTALTWTPNPLPDPAPIHSYRVNGNAATSSNWPIAAGYETNSSVFAIAQMGTWIANGTTTSQVVDTQMTAPVYGELSWNALLPAGGTVTLKVRSANNPDMSDALDWSGVTSFSSSPASLAGLSNLRYVQFQAALAQGAPPYTSLPELDNVKISWPGKATLVELKGYFTKRPDYGIFKVLVDGKAPAKALELKLSVADVYREKTFSSSSKGEVKPRNTGK